jgi:hypothetical protein
MSLAWAFPSISAPSLGRSFMRQPGLEPGVRYCVTTMSRSASSSICRRQK